MRKKNLKVSSALVVLEKPAVDPPLPDIQELFRYYNDLYFDDALGACIVAWAPRMRSSIGICRFIEAGHCEIRLSASLLKLRSSSDLKNSLLHEMVHAFLWIKENNKNRNKHSTNFWAIANEINSSCKDDDQRPSVGYNISDQHQFHEEAETSARLLTYSSNRHNSDRYNEVDISGFRGKQMALEDLSHVTRRKAEERKDKNNIKSQRKLNNFSSSVSEKPKNSENILKYQRGTWKKKCTDTNNEKNKSFKRKREVSLIIPWLGVCTDEESEEDKEPLINKRSVKRMKLKESKERSGQICLTPGEVIYLD